MPIKENTRWIIPPEIPVGVSEEFERFPPLIRQVLYNRGITEIEAANDFLGAREPEYDPFLLKDLEKAVEIIYQAIIQDDKIIVFGDYDVDGVTASALLIKALTAFGANVDNFIPNRFDEGYGLSVDALEAVLGMQPALIITVDCGVRSAREVAIAKEKGIQVIITDHHQPHAELPPADAIICPKQKGDDYPFKGLAGVGIAYKLAQGLLEKHPLPNVGAKDWVDLVAVGTVADLAPLDGENRVLVRQGLRQIRLGQNPGLLALANVSGTNIHTLGSQDIGFRIGPRLNAAGRLDSAAAAYEILMAKTSEEAGELALELDKRNKERQAITRDIQAAIEDLYDAEKNRWMLFFWDEAFNAGVVGLAASRLVEKYYRPAIVGVREGDLVRASCRSIEQLNITDALDECADLLLQHGGHAMAAGLSVAAENLDSFIAQFTNVCERELSPLAAKEELVNKIPVEGVVALKDLHPSTLEYYDLLEPIGNGNPFPLFVSREVKVRGLRQIGQEGSHLRLAVTDGKFNFDAVAFGFGNEIDRIADRESIDILYAYELNVYNGRKNLQLRIEDMDIGEEGKDTKIVYGE